MKKSLSFAPWLNVKKFVLIEICLQWSERLVPYLIQYRILDFSSQPNTALQDIKKLFYIKTFNVCLACIGYKYFCSLSNTITLLSFLQVLRYTQNIYLSKAKCFVLLVEYKYSFFELYFKKPNELWSHFPLLSPKSSWMSRIL